MSDSGKATKRLRSEEWFNNPAHPDGTVIYIERFLNYGITPEELRAGKPIIGIAQVGSDISPCNRGHIETAERVKAGIRDAGGIPFVFPVHPIQESCRRPAAALDRNLAYLGLVEVLHGYPFDGVVLTTGCDKTTPACLMAAATMNLPAIVQSGGPMLDGWYNGELAGSGTMVWEGRKQLAEGKITIEELLDQVAASSSSVGHCNTMGTALSMNSLAEALGMSLPGCGVIPAAYRERGQMAYRTGKRIVEMVHEDLTPSKVMTREAFENAIVVNTAIGGSTNCPVHLTAIARHLGVELSLQDWQDVGYDVPLLVNCQPAGKYLGESFHRAGGIPGVIRELLGAGRMHGGTMTVSGRTVAENQADILEPDREVIRAYGEPLKEQAGFLVLNGNLFDAALIKTCVISDEFRARYLSEPGNENEFTSRVIVFEGPEDYRERLNDPSLNIDDSCMLVIRGCGPVGYPGSGEVVNMQPPDDLLKQGIDMLPTMGDGRQSGTSASPSILNIAPESAAGGNLALLETGDEVRVDLNKCRVDLLVSDEALAKRREKYAPPELHHQTPWQEMYRGCVGQLDTGACIEFATKYRDVAGDYPRHYH
ncbi:MAG: IlvD/Edd family dehydratase [Verrucomicrobiota bacterium]|jgi:dihydroxy-acid dehydratase|nr:IlvD/Edd family dehydratase [Verrucomicrobiota bacterium]MDP6250668.1 IlvD/Edd family dehydratase [Verrucomicrobiota bacterium]MDP7177903.1 IlvD/Edd family dehydratase [Verrucomicrobiota bacterium]MDP7291457.1 IlvD/Edd family dehydratase [Verrucomicrobiota bacterium]MDP7440329.1 IlvD/Edd family dehydratase [Verrucomicrobiota bacterium]